MFRPLQIGSFTAAQRRSSVATVLSHPPASGSSASPHSVSSPQHQVAVSSTSSSMLGGRRPSLESSASLPSPTKLHTSVSLTRGNVGVVGTAGVTGVSPTGASGRSHAASAASVGVAAQSGSSIKQHSGGLPRISSNGNLEGSGGSKSKNFLARIFT